MKTNKWSQNLFYKYREIFFPSRCLLCGSLLLFQNGTGIEICDSCCADLEPIKGKCCSKCGLPLISEEDICIRCRNTVYQFKKHHPVFTYKGALKELLYYYKFKQRHILSLLFSRYLHNTINTLFPHLPIIPVPSRKRSFIHSHKNHLTPILNELRKNYSIKVIDCLQRKGEIPQKELSFEERKRNLKGKIYLKDGIEIKKNEILLFDDIFTTGATADECSRILKKHGIRDVYVITLAID